jgi:hypothetical protein
LRRSENCAEELRRRIAPKNCAAYAAAPCASRIAESVRAIRSFRVICCVFGKWFTFWYSLSARSVDGATWPLCQHRL